MVIRRLVAGDAHAFRDLRLEALRLHPEAYGSAYEIEGPNAVAWFAERLTTSEVFGAVQTEALVGVAGLYAEQGLKQKHKAHLWGLYVRPDARRFGIGRRLSEAVISAAIGRFELLHLSVTTTNADARRLYDSLGFVQFGIEHNARKVDGRYYDDVLMALDLRPKPAG